MNPSPVEAPMNARTAGFLTCGLMLALPFALGAQGNAKATKATARAADGLSIVYDIGGKGDTALVFLHGWCGDRHYWKHQIDAFAPNYRVVAVDQAGHGESGTERKEWTVAALAGDV